MAKEKGQEVWRGRRSTELGSSRCLCCQNEAQDLPSNTIQRRRDKAPWKGHAMLGNVAFTYSLLNAQPQPEKRGRRVVNTTMARSRESPVLEVKWHPLSLTHFHTPTHARSTLIHLDSTSASSMGAVGCLGMFLRGKDSLALALPPSTCHQNRIEADYGRHIVLSLSSHCNLHYTKRETLLCFAFIPFPLTWLRPLLLLLLLPSHFDHASTQVLPPSLPHTYAPPPPFHTYTLHYSQNKK